MALVPFPNKGRAPAPNEERDPDWDDSEHEDSAAGKMSFLDHLDELRRRIIYALLSVLVGCGVAFFWVDRIFQFVFTPMKAALPPGQSLIYTEPGEQFFLLFKDETNGKTTFSGYRMLSAKVRATICQKNRHRYTRNTCNQPQRSCRKKASIPTALGAGPCLTIIQTPNVVQTAKAAATSKV